VQEIPRLHGFAECAWRLIRGEVARAGSIIGLESCVMNRGWAGCAGGVHTHSQVLFRADRERDGVTQRVCAFANGDGLASSKCNCMVGTWNQAGSAFLQT